MESADAESAEGIVVFRAVAGIGDLQLKQYRFRVGLRKIVLAEKVLQIIQKALSAQRYAQPGIPAAVQLFQSLPVIKLRILYAQEGGACSDNKIIFKHVAQLLLKFAGLRFRYQIPQDYQMLLMHCHYNVRDGLRYLAECLAQKHRLAVYDLADCKDLIRVGHFPLKRVEQLSQMGAVVFPFFQKSHKCVCQAGLRIELLGVPFHVEVHPPYEYVHKVLHAFCNGVQESEQHVMAYDPAVKHNAAVYVFVLVHYGWTAGRDHVIKDVGNVDVVLKELHPFFGDAVVVY